MKKLLLKTYLSDIHHEWLTLLSAEDHKSYMINLSEFLAAEVKNKKLIYPSFDSIFSAFKLTPLSQVKVVIIGQDPYHGPSQAHGLCFSVQPTVAIPPSLRNIYLELENDLGIKAASHGFLSSWTKQGVLLLNSVLTVESNCPGSHRNQGWEQLTDRVIKLIAEKKKNLVFLLWGKYAQDKGQYINARDHLVLRAPHPSPFSAYKGFFGSRPFSQTNRYLNKHHIRPIDWQVPKTDSNDIAIT